jgi:hypothetical protein
MPRADQIRCTVAGLTPWALAIDRQDQCVSAGGLSCSVARTISATFCWLIDGLRPPAGTHAPERRQSFVTEALSPRLHRRW